jgi:hypothetical protein
MERSHPDSKIETDLALHRERLERCGSVGSPDQNVGAKPGTNRRLPAHYTAEPCSHRKALRTGRRKNPSLNPGIGAHCASFN